MSATMSPAYRNLVGGELVDGVDGATRDVLNPATGEVVSTYALDDYTRIKHAMVKLG